MKDTAKDRAGRAKHSDKLQSRPVVYQLFVRVFANVTDNCVPGGRIGTNGAGKMNDINDDVLADIAALGVTHIWYTGIPEHGHDADYTAYGIERHNAHVVKGRAGSPYAITDWYDVDPDISVDVPRRMAEFESLVERTKRGGMGVIIDFVPNHVGRQYHSDSAPQGVSDFGVDDDTDKFFSPRNNFYYIPRQQFAPSGVDLGEGTDRYIEFPAKATGNDCFSAFPGRDDWYETVKLNYGVDPLDGSRHFDPIPDTWHRMLDILRFWASKGVAGFRCDMAHMVPVEFWRWAISHIKREFPGTIFIAELYDVGIYRLFLDAGFDYLYDKVNLYDTLRGIESGEVSAARLTSSWQTVDGIGHRMLNFLENHDEQRFASDFYAGNAFNAIPSLIAMTAMSRGAVMVYNAQELGERGMDSEGFSGRDGRTTIFDYWSMDTMRRRLGPDFKPSDTRLTPDEIRLRQTYRQILTSVNASEALRQGAFFDLMYVNYDGPGLNPHRHFAFMRHSAGETVLVLLNFDTEPVQADVFIPAHAFDVLSLEEGRFSGLDLLTHDAVDVDLRRDSRVRMTAGAKSAAVWTIKTGNIENKSARNKARKQKNH